MAIKTLKAQAIHVTPDGRRYTNTTPTLAVDLTPAAPPMPEVPADFGYYNFNWGSDSGLQQRRVNQTYIGMPVPRVNNGTPEAIQNYNARGHSNGFNWTATNEGQKFTGTPGGPVIWGVLSVSSIQFRDGTSFSASIVMPIKIESTRTDGVDYKSVTLNLLNTVTGVTHTFTFVKGVGFGTGNTYHSETSEYKNLAARIIAIGSHGQQVKIVSVVVNI